MNEVLAEIIIDSTKDILSKNISIKEKYVSIRNLFNLSETDLRILLDSIGKSKQKQLDQRRKELL